jgi:arylsulfatase A-like enzyme
MHPSPFSFMRPAIAIGSLLFSGLVHAGIAEVQRPNIVFILCDDLGYGDLGVFFQNEGDGGRKAKVEMAATPRLDAIAAGGMQLRHHYTAAPVCAPARASLLLGVHQGHANVRDNQFDKALEDHHTIASVLKESGYRSICIGKWGLQGGKEMPAHPLNRGFDEYFGYIGHGHGHMHYPKEDRKPLYDGKDEVSEKYDKCYTTDLFTAKAKQFIIDHHGSNKEQPFLVYLAFSTPHAKTQAPSCAFPEGYGLNGGLQWLGIPGKMINTATGKPDSWLYPEHRDATWNDPQRGTRSPWPDTAKRYATMVRRIDDCVHDLVATLRDLGLEKNTLVVFTSDNGPSKESYLRGRDANGYPRSFDPGFFRGYGPFDGIKRDCYEGGVRVGAITYWPGTIPAGKISSQASQFHDWMPTFCEMAGLPAPARSDGVSLLPELTDRGNRSASTIYIEYVNRAPTPNYEDFLSTRRGKPRNQMQMLRAGDLVGVRYHIQSHDDDFQIYDVVKDPAQRRNLASSMSDLQQRFKDRVLQVRRPNPTAARSYMDSHAMPALDPSSPTVPGLEMQVIAHPVPWPVAASAAKQESRVTVAAPQAAEPAIGTAHGLIFSGWLKIPAEGSYTFSLPDGCRAIMKLHEATVLDTDRGDGGGTVRLDAGFHPLFFSVAIKENSPAPELRWALEGKEASPMPAEAFWSSKG